jgi:NADPH-dependent curcumin reductase CurA
VHVNEGSCLESVLVVGGAVGAIGNSVLAVQAAQQVVGSAGSTAGCWQWLTFLGVTTRHHQGALICAGDWTAGEPAAAW